MKPTRLLIVDDHVLVRKGILMFLSTEHTIEIVGEAESGQDALRQAKASRPDVILLDLIMPQGDGLEAITCLKQELPDIKIIVLTTFYDEGRVKAALKAGANGFLLKDADGATLLRAIQAVQKGGMPLHPTITEYLLKETYQNDHSGYPCLTEREKEVLQWVARGLSNKRVGQALHLSEGTIKTHVSNILTKLHMASRTEAATWAIQAGLISLEEPLQSLN
jgi:DNA-binding NarL/FixJ family response regulator